MKKRFLTIAIAASLAAPLSAAMAGDATLYGRAHLTLDHVTPDSTVSDSASGDGTGLSLNSRKSAIGVKGSEDLGGGMKFFFKMEWDVDMDDGNGTASVKESDAGIDINGDGDTNDTIGGGSGITARDRYIGMKTGMGTVKLGTLTSSYKETSAWVDPFWHTIAEGRGVLGMASGLAGGRGVDSGRATDTVQYRSPKMGGMQMVINRSFTGGGDENTGLGLRYTTKDIKFFWEWVGIQTGGAFNLDPTGDAISGTKIGGTFKTGGTTIGLQVENTEKRRSMHSSADTLTP